MEFSFVLNGFSACSISYFIHLLSINWVEMEFHVNYELCIFPLAVHYLETLVVIFVWIRVPSSSPDARSRIICHGVPLPMLILLCCWISITYRLIHRQRQFHPPVMVLSTKDMRAVFLFKMTHRENRIYVHFIHFCLLIINSELYTFFI